ncbi:PHD finger protein 7-like [Anas platyrhynchos]|uniref:PHD finger protein 7-like n=1 Tax=Anas platyrhynchos TaxID=8839 RepID=UPI003AF2D94B
MSARNENAPDSRERACMLCGRVDVDVNVCGHTYERGGLCAHLCCMFFASELYRQGLITEGMEGILIDDVWRAIWQAFEKQCFVCGERGATITCTVRGCERCFHLPCASEGECVTQYCGQYRSFCSEHRPQQAAQAAPEQGTTCIICMEPVGDSTSYHTMVCPTCNHAWFHRRCIQGHAMCAGILCFQCPICRDKIPFCLEMYRMGIRIPVRPPTWEDNDAFASQRERHQRCDASECLYPRGREQAEVHGPWQLLLCRSCAAEGTHRRCSNLTNRAGTWECASCAGVDNASSANQGLASSSTSSAEAPGPSHGPPAPESSSLSSSSSSQAAPGPSHSSQGTESGRPATEERAIRQPVRQAQDTCNDPGRSRTRSRAAEPSAESSTPSLARQRAPGTSSHSMVPEGRLPPSQRGRPQRRSRSPLEHQATDAQSQPQRRRRRCHEPQTSAGSSSTTRSPRQAALGSPSGSPRRVTIYTARHIVGLYMSQLSANRHPVDYGRYSAPFLFYVPSLQDGPGGT